MAWRDEVPLAMSPDLICVLDTVSGEAFGTETIGYGRRVSVVVLLSLIHISEPTRPY